MISIINIEEFRVLFILILLGVYEMEFQLKLSNEKTLI